MELTCEKGKCDEGKTASGQIKYCKYKPVLSEMAEGETPSGMCHYYMQKYIALLKIL